MRAFHLFIAYKQYQLLLILIISIMQIQNSLGSQCFLGFMVHQWVDTKIPIKNFQISHLMQMLLILGSLNANVIFKAQKFWLLDLTHILLFITNLEVQFKLISQVSKQITLNAKFSVTWYILRYQLIHFNYLLALQTQFNHLI